MKLKPCPFCGGEAKLWSGNIDDDYLDVYYDVYCTACNCMTPKFHAEESAITFWNRRRPIDKIVEQLEELISYNKERSRMYDGHTHYDSEIMGISRAIEIVKGGAV